MKHQTINLTKASGELEPFSFEKYKRSLLHADVSSQEIDRIFKEIAPLLYDTMPAEELYQLTLERLKEKQPTCANKYTLKEALRLLGPTGFPFEQLVSKLLQAMGYTTKIGEVVEGNCVGHEIDILAEKDKAYTLVECKFHTSPKIKSDVKTTLYMKARFDDIAAVKKPIADCLIVSNTRFTTEAIEYAECTGIQLLAWSYPEPMSLEFLIKKYRLYPITTLLSLKKREKRLLLDKNIVLCNQILEQSGILKTIGLSATRALMLEQECASLCIP